MTGDVSEVTQLRIGVTSFAVVTRHTGCATATGDSFEDLPEFAAAEGEEEFTRCRVERTMACPFRRQVFVANSRELQSPTIGRVGDEDVRVDEVM